MYTHTQMIMLKSNKHLFFCAITTESVPNVSGHHITFLRFFAQSYFLITCMLQHQSFFCYVVLLLLNWCWSWSWCEAVGT